MAVARAKSQRSMRFWYFATFKAFDGQYGSLEPRRGGRVQVVDLDTLEETTNAKDTTLQLRAREGDRLILFGSGQEETCGAIVIHVEPLGYRDRLHVQLHDGVVKDGEVRVLRSKV